MPRRKLAESLTARIFLITALVLLCAGGITFGFIAWATPITYTAVLSDDLARQVNALVDELADTAFENCGPVLDAFLRDSGADAMLVGPDGQIADTGSQFAIQPAFTDGQVSASPGYTAETGSVTYATEAGENGDAVTVTTSQQATITADVRFSGRDALYTLYVTPRVKAENPAVQALCRMAPWLLSVLLVFSLLSALAYSRYITRPIVRLSGIAGKMARLDFNWTCPEQRRDEIGKLGRSFNEMSRRLSAALTELEAANRSLQGEVERERERDRQRMDFFSAASHELKTPLTILKGQLAGMLEGVDVYRDRDKYLLRSLQVAGRMEKLVREMLAISRMESGATPVGQEPVELSALLERQIHLDAELFHQRGQRLVSDLTPGILVTGDPSLLGKAVGNLLSNAAFYSPEGAEIRVWCGLMAGSPALTVENAGAQIGENALPHLFEAFYREEGSRSRSTGGSGLGLYLVRTILARHGATCTVENTGDGVRATARFPA